eukprot:366012-Chlamydomonas_euryale.AAC.10
MTRSMCYARFNCRLSLKQRLQISAGRQRWRKVACNSWPFASCAAKKMKKSEAGGPHVPPDRHTVLHNGLRLIATLWPPIERGFAIVIPSCKIDCNKQLVRSRCAHWHRKPLTSERV